MYKLGHILCDRCRMILATNFNFNASKPTWETVKLKRRDPMRNRRMDFCDEYCRIMQFRGRKYWARKIEHMKRNGAYVETS